MIFGKYKKVSSELDLILKYFNPSGKTIIDSGCGSGYLSLQLAEKGAKVYGVDTKSVIDKTKSLHRKNIVFKAGKSEKLPFKKDFADVIIYYASFHHIPEMKMISALLECRRVLKKNGLAIFVEPSLEKGCYFELLKIVLEERKIQRMAYKIINKIEPLNFNRVAEKHFYLKRTIYDFSNLVNQFIKREKDKQAALIKAENKLKLAEKRSRKDYNNIFKSTARINVFRKIN